MPEAILTKQEVEPGKVDRLREWMAELRDREDEVMETFTDEGIHAETVFLEHTDDATYLVTYLDADDVVSAFEAFEDSLHDIDHEHQSVMDEVLVDGTDVGEYEPLSHLVNPERSNDGS